ncbi:hypothetical protein ACFE04_025456 [Oxalis oulophora]
MTIQSQLNHNRPFSIIKLLLVVLLCLSIHAKAQSSPSPSDEDYSRFQSGLNPTMAIILVILVAAFFFMGFLSVYVRRCAQRRLQERYDPSLRLLDAGRYSMRGAARGLGKEVIKSFPTFLYSNVKGLRIGQCSLECSVCLNEFEDHETLRLIPKCNHVFHPQCIDAWLTSHTTCPVCRANLVPKPDEVVSISTVQEIFPEPPIGSDNRANDNNDSEVSICVDQPENSIIVSERNKSPSNSFRSKSTGSTLGLNKLLLQRSYSSGDQLVQTNEKYERFTLLLPDDVRNQLVMSSNLNRTSGDDEALPTVSSTKKGYRSNSRGKGFFNYERFALEDPSKSRGFKLSTPKFFSRNNSVRSPKTESDEENPTILVTMSMPDTGPFDGERSFDNLRPQRSLDSAKFDS